MYSTLAGLIILGVIVLSMFWIFQLNNTQIYSQKSSQLCSSTLSSADLFYNRGKVSQFYELFTDSCLQVDKIYVSSKRQLQSQLPACEKLANVILNQKDFLSSISSELCIPCMRVTSSKGITLSPDDFEIEQNMVLQQENMEIEDSQDMVIKLRVFKEGNAGGQRDIKLSFVSSLENPGCSINTDKS